MVEEGFGSFFKKCRIASGLTLRAFCQENGFDPGNISKLERGRLGPPESREKLQEFATALGLVEESKEWFEFFDRAAAERGRIPPDFLEDEELMAKLPVVFRTIRGAKVDAKHLEDLIERIRRT